MEGVGAAPKADPPDATVNQFNVAPTIEDAVSVTGVAF